MTKEQAQKKIAKILLESAGDMAYDRLIEESKFAKQTVEETASRIAGNLLQSLVTRKPGGYVDMPMRYF